MLKHGIVFLLLITSFTTMAQKGSELLIQANRATLQRNFAEAISLYNQYIQLNPEDFRGYFNRGTTEFNAGQYANSIKDFDKTLSLNPIYKEANYFRGQCYVKQKQYTLAINDYNKILLKEPNNIAFLKLRSEAYSANNQNKLAIQDLTTAIEINKLSGDLYKRRAEIKVITKDHDGAIKDYNSVEKLIPTYKMVHYLKGNLYLKIDEVEFACDEFQLALDNRIVIADRAFETNCK